ncbi:porin [Paraburkholderia youngii]|uniref:porin n=1 Tax=Paraburkholderia youngii TaxID=2782701 RepID=UPI003D1C4EF0
MKKHILSLALLSSCATSAFAQSSVTLYGVVDASIVYTSNQKGHSAWEAVSGNESGSRWGMLGSEDLGGGSKAIFRLENGFNLFSGKLAQGGREFGRQAYVGMSNKDLGTVTLGRQYNAEQDYLAPIQIGYSLTAYSLHPYDTDALNSTFRTNNMAKYVSPTVAGLQVTTTYAFSNSTDFAGNRSWSVGAKYAHGPLSAAAAYVMLDHPGSDTAGAVASDNYYPSSFIHNVIRQQIWGAGTTYTIGNATVGLLYTNTVFSLTGGTERFQNIDGGLRYQVTPTVTATVEETYTLVGSTASAPRSSHYWQTNAGVQYFLSKSTDVYLNGIYQRASGVVAFITSATAASSNQSQVVAVAGIRHKF